MDYDYVSNPARKPLKRAEGKQAPLLQNHESHIPGQLG